MYPPLHVTIKVIKDRDTLNLFYRSQYGFGTDAVAYYDQPSNTIYAWGSKISESVLVHEMAHSVIDNYFQVRPPRKIEELLAMHVDEQLRE